MSSDTSGMYGVGMFAMRFPIPMRGNETQIT